MSARTVFAHSLLLALFISSFTPGATAYQGPGGDKKKLKKQLDKVERDIKVEERRLEKKKDTVEREYGRLMNAATRSRLAERLRDIASRHASGLNGSGRNETVRAIEKELRPVVQREVGKTLEKLLLSDLTSNLVDRVRDGACDGPEVVRVTIEDLFPEGNFSADFDGVIKPELFRRYTRLLQKKELLKRQIAEIERRENALKAGVPAQMFKVPGGTHRIGMDDGEIKKVADQLGHKHQSVIQWWNASPLNKVPLQDYFIDTYEVTCAWYTEYLKDNPEAAKPGWWEDGKYPAGFENRPVTDISFNDARAFSRWMGRRLPTEFEWEAASRFTKQKNDLRVWPWGNSWEVTDIRCNNDLAIELQLRRSIPHTLPPLMPVGSFPNGVCTLGGHDFAGNAYELTSSRFLPYEGFKPRKISGRRLSTSDFNREQVVIRGGDCNKRDVAVTTTWRYGIAQTAHAPWVGFRTAASATRGKDHVAAITEYDALKRYLVDLNPLPSDQLDRRQYADLMDDDPAGYSSIMAGGWDPEKKLPTRAKHVTLIARRANDFRNFEGLKALAKDAPVMLGYLHLDVPSVEPALEPGSYFILWQNTFAPEPDEPPAGEDKAAKKEQEEAAAVPEAFLFQKIGGRRKDPIRVTSFFPPVPSSAQPTRVVPLGSDQIELTMAFPVRYKPRSSFVVTLRLKTEPGLAKVFK